MKYTKGKWKALKPLNSHDYNIWVHQATISPIVIAIVKDNKSLSKEENDGNAKLIENAANLYEVLKQAERYLNHPEVQAIPFALPVSNITRNITNLLKEIEDN